ncbi:nitric oxide synthase 1-like [Mytilus galloprovincialis]|uniref:nitric oxide synthase 1-like n=1 Tax=Mytilus galloprovincialis TaxID=29158 RepID=UPI003F7BDF25
MYPTHPLSDILCGNKCVGSLMETLSNKPGTRPKEELLLQAKDFIQQYYMAIKSNDTIEHRERWSEVKSSIDNTGTYDLTLKELIFGSKQAWRNAPRCIGRIQWSNLQIFDARDVKTARGMFHSICNHLKYATNNGKIRSAITIFKQRTDVNHDFRVWNSQLITYAGYKQSDGSIIGDPINVDFTALCIEMGWRGRNGMFDVLPLVLQANGDDPELFELPSHLIMEVHITHPTYPSLADLGLRWFCVPAVSGMKFDCGGLEFTACPFSGWYMSTEIACRDLCDKQRYNLVEKIARNLGMDTRNNASLWKDKAVIEINIAVLHSFQSIGATIVDHHTASDSFMIFMKNEYKQRGGCPADWVWIVPPISGSLTPVFHQEMVMFKLKPSYEYQDEVWRTFVRKKDRIKRSKSHQSKLGFKCVASVVFSWTSLMMKVLSKRVKCTILYATETGRSERYAHTLHKIFRQAFNSRVLNMDSYNLSELRQEQLILFVTSTFGNGDPPENGKNLARALTTAKELPLQTNGNKRHTNGHKNSPLNYLKFSVFGLGSSAYPNFCAFSKLIDKTMESLGATRIYSIGEGDELCGQEEAFKTWAKRVYQVACGFFNVGNKIGLNDASDVLEKSDTIWRPETFRVIEVPIENRLSLGEEYCKVHKKSVFKCRLTERIHLEKRHSSKQTILGKIDISANIDSMKYSPGDHLLLFPNNAPALVSGIIDRLVDAPDFDEVLQLQRNTSSDTRLDRNGNHDSWNDWGRYPPCTLTDMLTRYLDISSPPSQELLNILSSQAVKTEEKFKIKRLVNNTRIFDEWKNDGKPTILDVLKQFSSIQLTPAFLISQLPLLLPRYYSISSSLDAAPGEIHVTADVLEYQTPDGIKHQGVCSNWLNNLEIGEEIYCNVKKAPLFHLPNDQSVPIIMVGPGTGIAPFRGFWMQRKADIEHELTSRNKRNHSFGEMYLYFGCHNTTADNIYRDEIRQCEKEKILTKCFFAFSREPGIKKTYVQDLIKRNGRDIYKMIVKENGHFYICGSIQMASDVKKMLRHVIQSWGKKSESQVDEYIDKMKDENRLHEDIFGIAVKKLKERTKTAEQKQNRTPRM